jgi:hypothetical protein
MGAFLLIEHLMVSSTYLTSFIRVTEDLNLYKISCEQNHRQYFKISYDTECEVSEVFACYAFCQLKDTQVCLTTDDFSSS